MTEEAKPPTHSRMWWWLLSPLLALALYSAGMAPLNACVWKWDQDHPRVLSDHHWLAMLNKPMTKFSFRSVKTHQWIWTYQSYWTNLLGVHMMCLNVSTWSLN